MLDALPPSPVDAAASAAPALEAASCSGGRQATQAQADQTLNLLRQNFPGTSFESAWPSCVAGLFAARMENGRVAYTDKSARYLVLGLVFDSVTGAALDQQMEPKPSSKP